MKYVSRPVTLARSALILAFAATNLIDAGSASPAAASTYTVLHTFCPKSYCEDGKTPYGGLTMDSAGNLYGTTGREGRHGGVNVFELAKTQSGWTYKVLYSFCAKSNCADGMTPWGNLILD